MITIKFIKTLLFLSIGLFVLSACGGGDARKYPTDPAKRVKKNLEEGRGFRLNETFKGKSTTYEFASSNELWRASLDTIDFMPLVSANYSGGIIITDWYSTNQDSVESIKISIRFLTNEIRSDALDIKVFNKKCLAKSNCTVSEKTGSLIPELKEKILKTAAIYKKENKTKDSKPYTGEQKYN